ncbi:MAG: hypothetical protein ACKPGK_14890 [Verrucomicrobiota bacterium]
MNTKSLLLAAVVAAVGAVSGSAQVTSQNIVGYVRLSLTKGFNLIGNQLNNGNNAIGTVLNAPEGTTVYKFTGGKYVANSFVDGAWDNKDMKLSPGEGFFVNVTAATTITLIGEVSLSNTVNIAQGYNLVSIPLPLAGSLTDAAAGGFPAKEGDNVFQWTGSGFSAKSFVDGAWEPSAPTLKVGEGFFVQGVARTYTRNFSVN